MTHRPRRVLLFMPGDSQRKIEKGAALLVDSIIMDLEDGVAFSQKDAARQITAQALQSLDFGKAEKLVRVNPVGSALIWDDIATTLPAQPDGYVIPKVESAAEVQAVAQKLAELGAPDMPLLAIIESARGVINLPTIAQTQNLLALLFGAEDLAGDIGAVRSAAMGEVMMARQWVVLHAKANGLQAIDTPYVDIHNLEGLAEEAQTARQWGYDGKLCIHPKHLDIVRAAFTPSAEEVDAARALLQAYQDHQTQGSGVFAYHGKMVDMPMIRAAENVLARAKSD